MAKKLGYTFSRLLRKLRQSDFFKNIMIVMSGTAFAQIIGYAMSPVISRLFTPGQFGVFGSFNAVSGVIAAGVTLQYSQALMLPKEKEKAFNLFGVSVLSTLGIAFLSLVFCIAAPGTVNSLMKTNGVWALILLVLASLIIGFNLSLQAWAVRVKAFKHTSASQVIQSLSSNGAKVIFGLLKTGAPGLILSSIIAYMFASINLAKVLLSELKTLKSKINWREMQRLAKEYHDFPMYSASQNVINALSSGLPVLLLARFFDIDIAGAYAFAMTILHVPMGFILTALRQVLFQKASESHYQGKSLSSLYVKTTATLFAMVLIPLIIMVIWAPQIFVLVFGSRWLLAGELARSLMLWLAIVFCNLPAVLFARIIRVQRFVFFYDLILLVMRTLALLAGGMYLNVYQTVMLFALVGLAMNLFLILRVGYLVLKKEGDVDIIKIHEYLFKD